VKKGFTLSELIITIGLLGVVMMIAIGSYTYINKGIKEKLLEEKYDTIEASAEIYGGDNPDEFTTTNNNQISISVAYLLQEKYLEPDEGTENDIINPVTNESMAILDVCITKTNKIYVAKIGDCE